MVILVVISLFVQEFRGDLIVQDLRGDPGGGLAVCSGSSW